MGIDTRVKTHLYGDLINLLNIIDSIGRDVDSFNRYINTHYSNRTQSAGMDAMSFDYVLREIINHHANSLINDYIKFVNSHAKNFPDIQDPYHIFTNL